MNGEECGIPIVVGLAYFFIYLFIYSLLTPLASHQLCSCIVQLDLRKLLHFLLAPLLSWGPIE